MLDKMRNNLQGWMSWSIILLIGITFTLWGVSDFFSWKAGRYAAKVNGEKISWNTVNSFYDRMSRQMGQLPINEQMLKEQVRMMLIQRAALLSSARTLGFRVGDEQIIHTLASIPAFQVDGHFSKDRYLDTLNKTAFTDLGFRKELAQDVLLAQLEQGLKESTFSLPSEVNAIVALVKQQRNFGYTILPLQKFRSGVEVSKSELEKYYDSHQTSFLVPEQVSVEYVELSLDRLAKKQEVTEPELKSAYEAQLEAYAAPERVRARHILIPVKTEDKTEDEQAKAKAESLLAKIKKGENFEKLAKENSSDTVSGSKGGDLGWFTRGKMVPAFEKAAFGLSKPDKVLSEVIKTPYGYHIIQLVDRKPAETRPFSEVRELVLEQVQREKAQGIFSSQAELMAKLAFENPGSLEPLAKALDVNIQQSGPLTRLLSRESAAASSDPLAKTPAVLEAAFSEPVLKQKNNSEPISMGEYTTLVLRVKEHRPAKQQTLAEVEKTIEETLIVEKTKTKVKELAEQLEKRVHEGEAAASLARQLNLTWNVRNDTTREAQDVEKPVLAMAFQIPYRTENALKNHVKIFPLANGDYALIVLQKVTPGALTSNDAETQQKMFRQSLNEINGQLEFSLYTNRVFTEAKVEIAPQPDNE